MCAAHWEATRLLMPLVPPGYLESNTRCAVNLARSMLLLLKGPVAIPTLELCELLGQALGALQEVS